jgi:hypothetical protein
MKEFITRFGSSGTLKQFIILFLENVMTMGARVYWIV